MKYKIERTNRFDRDLRLAKKQGKDLDKLMRVINRLANGEQLEEKYHDHNLKGNYVGYRECHVSPDWLLVYKIHNATLILLLYRLGSHADLFDE